jgi:hypothetical protein
MDGFGVPGEVVEPNLEEGLAKWSSRGCGVHDGKG